MSRRQLTKKQHEFLEHLRAHIREEKVWPTYRELVDHFGYRSPNSVTQNLQALSKKGYLRRDRDGYHLVDRESKEGGVAVAGVIRGGALAPATGSERVTLQSLFQGHEDVRAIRVEPTSSRDPELASARFVFVADSDQIMEGEALVTFSDGHVGVLTYGPDDGTSDDAVVLGKYVGYAGPHGVVLPGAGLGGHPAEALSPSVQETAMMRGVAARA